MSNAEREYDWAADLQYQIDRCNWHTAAELVADTLHTGPIPATMFTDAEAAAIARALRRGWGYYLSRVGDEYHVEDEQIAAERIAWEAAQ